MSTSRHDAGHPGYSSVSRGCGSIDVNSSNGLAPAGITSGCPSMSTIGRPPPVD
ncbi:MAG: hypothetical protein WCK33_11855 [Phycisphaerae bacterium]